jgi:Fe-S-cluster-containing dehydrogenase component
MARNGLLIDYEYCTGCHTCEVACKQELDLPVGKWGIKLLEDSPWQVAPDKWEYNFIPLPTELCNLCGARVAQGKKPACVQHCQASVMEYGEVEELAKKMGSKRKMVLFAP